MTTIYVLLDNNQIRFIGKTTKADLNDKLVQHQMDAISDPEKFGWIANMFTEGKKPEIKSIFSYSDEQSEHYERLFLHDFKFFLGIRLTKSETSRMENLFHESIESENGNDF
jgi:hypothetical protein